MLHPKLAFASWCVKKAAANDNAKAKPTLKPSGSAQALWFKNRQLALQPNELKASDLPVLFVHRHDGGKGHVGFVAGLDEDTGQVVTIEGNSDHTGSRTGGSVVVLTHRTTSDPKLLGYVRIE